MLDSSLIAIYPGSFDPITNGHLDVIERGGRMVERLVVAVLRNAGKQPLFSVQERIAMLTDAVAHYAHVEVASFDGLLVDFAFERGADVILRGIRAISDYELEWQMALMNRRLRPRIETVFLMAREEYSFLSSHIVKEVAQLGGDVSSMVPPAVNRRLQERFRPTLRSTPTGVK